MSSRTAKTSRLWCAANAEQRAEIARLHWRDLPEHEILQTTTSLDLAVAAARELTREQGVGHVLKLEVTAELLQRYPGGHIRAEAQRELVASLQHTITEHAHYSGGLAEIELQAAERAIGRRIPDAWRGYLRGACWFHRGWMRDGTYVWLYPAAMSVELSFDDQCPGMFVIGSDGASEQLVIDLRERSPRVLLANVVRSGWGETLLQAPSVTSFLTQIEAGTFAFSFT